jgi:superfamily II DNA or RNA helicase
MATVSRAARRSGPPAKSPRRHGRQRRQTPDTRLSRTRPPEELSLEAWQTQLRRQFGAEQSFGLKNLGEHPVFSEFQVINPQSKSAYRVAIRGTRPGDNYCSCPDFSTNGLGTCKHIEFTLARLAGRRGGKAALKDGFQPTYSEVYVQYGSRREVRFRPGTECPVELARLASGYFDSEGRLNPEAFTRFETFLSRAGAIDHELRCYEDALRLVAEVRDGDRRREVLAKAFPRGTRSAAFKNLVKATLYDYQREGALFAARAGRSLIGDEMGLGKTIQALAAAEIMARHLGVERVLIVCPTSLKHQWEREIARFTDRTALVVGGLSPERQRQFAAESFFKITNYDTVHRDLDLIAGWSPDLVILDEAQRIKNWNTRTAKAVKRIASPHAIVLTGTPLENRLEELVSIVQFIDQHRLGPTFRFLHDHQVHDDHGRVIGYRDLDQIGQSLEAVLIRRRKDQVLSQLPERLDKTLFVPMTPEQHKLHAENQEIVAKVVAKWRRFGFLTEADQRRLMIALQAMRMSCDSTYLLDQSTDFGIKADELVTLLDEVYEEQGVKAVVFSQWLRMHELLVRRFPGKPWEHVLFHGGVQTVKRRGLVDRFRQEDACRAFLSTDAGGVGLNLQHANVVINMDLPWNPAVLEQRIGRVHRLGQQRPVRVVNFVSQGTIEEGMLNVLRFKKSLFAGVLDGGEKEVFLGGTRLKRFLETVEQTTSAIGSPCVQGPGENGDGSGAAPENVASGNGDGRRSRPSDQSDAPATDLAVTSSSPPVDPLAGLLANGLALIEQLAAASRGGKPAATGSAAAEFPAARGNQPTAASGMFQVDRDTATGQSYLRLAMPDPDTLDRVLRAVGGLLEGMRR